MRQHNEELFIVLYFEHFLRSGQLVNSRTGGCPCISDFSGKSGNYNFDAVAVWRFIMAGELKKYCVPCEGKGLVEGGNPMTVLTIAETNRPMEPCRICEGSGKSIGVESSIEEYLNYFNEPCAVTDEIFSLARQIQESQGSLSSRGQIELKRFRNRRWIPQNPGTYFEMNIYVAVLLPDGNFAIQYRRKSEFENPDMQVWGIVEEDIDWYQLPLESASDLFALFDFDASAYYSSGTEIEFSFMPPGKREAEIWKHLPWRVTRKYEKGYGLLATLQKIQKDLEQGTVPKMFVASEEKPRVAVESPPESAQHHTAVTSEQSASPESNGQRSEGRNRFDPMSIATAAFAGLLTFLGFMSAYYAAHFFTHMWGIPWGSETAVQFADWSAGVFEYSLWTAGLWAVISAVFPRLPGVIFLATAHAVQSGISWPVVFLIPPLSSPPEWVSAFLEKVTVDVNEWLFFTSLIAVPVTLILMHFAGRLREKNR